MGNGSGKWVVEAENGQWEPKTGQQKQKIPKTGGGGAENEQQGAENGQWSPETGSESQK